MKNRYLTLIIVLFSGMYAHSQIVKVDELTAKDSSDFIYISKGYNLVYSNSEISFDDFIIKDDKLHILSQSQSSLNLYNLNNTLEKSVKLDIGRYSNLFFYDTDQAVYLRFDSKYYKITGQNGKVPKIEKNKAKFNSLSGYNKWIQYINFNIYTMQNSAYIGTKYVMNNDFGRVYKNDKKEVLYNSPMPVNADPEWDQNYCPIDIGEINGKLYIFDTYSANLNFYDNNLKLINEINLANKFPEYKEPYFIEPNDSTIPFRLVKTIKMKIMTDRKSNQLYLCILNKKGFSNLFIDKIYQIRLDQNGELDKLIPVVYEKMAYEKIIQIYNYQIYSLIQRENGNNVYSHPVNLQTTP